MYSIWLLPEKNSYAEISATIKNNMEYLGRPFYQPHLTVINIPDGNAISDIRCALNNLELSGKIILKINDKAATNNQFYQSHFMTFEYSKDLENLNEILKLRLHVEEHFFPHLSLAYGAKNSDRKFLEAPELEHIAFDSLAIVTDSPYESDEAIASWNIIHSVKL